MLLLAHYLLKNDLETTGHNTLLREKQVFSLKN